MLAKPSVAKQREKIKAGSLPNIQKVDDVTLKRGVIG
jgi:hypothetical protein